MSQLVTPKQLADALGVGVSSVKRWADSGTLRAARTGRGHRRIEVSEAFRFAHEHGLRLIAPERLGIGLGKTSDTRRSLRVGANELRAMLERGDEAGAVRAITGQHTAGKPLARIADDLIAPALAPIGELWHEDAGGIAVEHAATRACFRAVRRIQEVTAEPAADAPLAVGAAFHGDQHGLASLLCAAVLADNGWNAVDLGDTLPAAALLRYIEHRGPSLIWLSATQVVRPRSARQALRRILDVANSMGAAVVLGGQGAHLLRTHDARCSRLTTMAELEAFANGLYAPGPAGDFPHRGNDPLSRQTGNISLQP